MWLAKYYEALVAVKILSKVRSFLYFGIAQLILARTAALTLEGIAPACTSGRQGGRHLYKRVPVLRCRNSPRTPALLLLLPPPTCWVQITRPNLTSSMLQQTLLRNLRKEAVLMSKLRHPNGESPVTCQSGSSPWCCHLFGTIR